MKKSIVGLVIAISVCCLWNSSSFAEDCTQAQALFQQAVKLRNNVADAIQKEALYQEALAICPNYGEAQNNLGDLYEKQGRFAEALTAYQKALAIDATLAYPYLNLGNVYVKTGQYAQAAAAYQQALQRLDPMRGESESLKMVIDKRLAALQNIQAGGLVNADTIVSLLRDVRLPGEVVSLSFGDQQIPFDFDQAVIRRDAETQLQEIGKALQTLLTSKRGVGGIADDEHIVFEIAGHTDIRGSDTYNLILSKKRADAVVNYLVKEFELPRDSFAPKGYGERAAFAKCAAKDEACYALNRRVELKKIDLLLDPNKQTRSGSMTSAVAPEASIAMLVGAFFQKIEEPYMRVLQEESRLRSQQDKYFIFFRPLQDCYVNILQKDASGRIAQLFPQKSEDEFVQKKRDYWVPGFGQAYTLDATTGIETLYIVATSWSLRTDVTVLIIDDLLEQAIDALEKRPIDITPPIDASQTITSEELANTPEKLNTLIEEIQGEGGWVKEISFEHE